MNEATKGPNAAFPTIRTVDALLTQIKYLHRAYNEHLWFRGQQDADWGLVPGVQRYNLTDIDERHLTNDFRIRASRVMENAPDRKDYSSWMAHMQHYGLPTRMLDWTQSPLIAAFFALEKYNQKDSCIWVLRPGLLNKTEIGDGSLYPVDSGTAARMLQPAFTDNPIDNDKGGCEKSPKTDKWLPGSKKGLGVIRFCGKIRLQ